MDPFLQQLAELCRTEVTRSKWVIVTSHAAGRTRGERMALAGTNWLNLRFVSCRFLEAAKVGVHFEAVPFTVAHGTDLMAGVVDLMFQSGDGCHVRDYKTDVSLEPSVYVGQLKAYHVALKSMSCAVADARLVPVRASNDEHLLASRVGAGRPVATPNERLGTLKFEVEDQP